MPILVLPPRYTPDSIAISKAAGQHGWQVERLASWNVPEWLKGQDAVIYGEPLFVSVVAPMLGVELLQPSYDWLPTLPQRYRQRTVRLTDMETARRWMQPAFIKPVDDKCFRAALYNLGTELPNATDIPDSEPVLISDPVKWEAEFRTFVVQKQVVTISPYLRDGKLAEGPDQSWPATDVELESATAFCNSLLSDESVNCPSAFVLDVGIIAHSGWAVVEANPAWGSGLYGCELTAVLSVLRRACLRADQISDANRLWIRPK